MSTPKYFLVAGATGRQGGAVIKALLSAETEVPAEKVYAITRNAQGTSAQRLASIGVSIVIGDLNDSRSIFAQIDSDKLADMAAFLAQAHGPTEVTDAERFIDAALSARIPYFVYSSVDRGGRTLSDQDPSYCKTFSDKFHIEQHLRSVAASSREYSTRMDYTILRPTWFADNADWGFAGRLCMTAWRDIMQGKRMQVTVTKDIGRWAAEALLRPDRAEIRNKALSIASDELSFPDIDRIFREETGRPVATTYGWLARSTVWMIKDLRTMFAWINERPYGADIDWLRGFVEPTPFRQWVKETVVAH